MKIIILVESDDDVEFAKQVAQDIPHETYSASDIPIEVWNQSTLTSH